MDDPYIKVLKKRIYKALDGQEYLPASKDTLKSMLKELEELENPKVLSYNTSYISQTNKP